MSRRKLAGDDHLIRSVPPAFRYRFDGELAEYKRRKGHHELWLRGTAGVVIGVALLALFVRLVGS